MRQPLFERKCDDRKYIQYLNMIADYGDLYNIEKWNNKLFLKLYISGYEEENLSFRFSVLKRWILNNENINSIFTSKLDKYIQILRLETYLTYREQNYIYQLQSYVFSLTRNIKSLIVNFHLMKGEDAYFHYDFAEIYQHKANHITMCGELYITSERIIITSDVYILWFNLENINKVFDDGKYIYISYLNNYYLLNFNDIELFKLSYKKVCDITKKEFRYVSR